MPKKIEFVSTVFDAGQPLEAHSKAKNKLVLYVGRSQVERMQWVRATNQTYDSWKNLDPGKAVIPVTINGAEIDDIVYTNLNKQNMKFELQELASKGIIQVYDVIVLADADFTNLSFGDANPDTITRVAGDWTTNGVVTSPGQRRSRIIIQGSTSNDGDYLVHPSTSPTATVLTLDAAESLTVEATATGITVTLLNPLTGTEIVNS